MLVCIFRTNRKLDCPIRGCLSRRLVRLDRHLQRIHGLKRSDPTYQTYMSEAKGRQAGASLGTAPASAVDAPEPSAAAVALDPPMALIGACPAVAPAPVNLPDSESDSESEEGHPSRGRPRRSLSTAPCLRLYLEYLTGPNPTSKKRENSLQAAQHVRLFLGLMADVSPGEAFADNLAFLKDTERCHL